MEIQFTYYLEVISSWCHWAEPTWSELKRRYAGVVDFAWKIAQMPAEGYPVSREQCDWFYRRSGTLMRSPYLLNSGWLEPGIRQYTVPNLVAEAARGLGVEDDCVRLALAEAALRSGERVGRWEVATRIASEAGGIPEAELRAQAQSPDVARRVEETTGEFLAMQVTQRPAFLITNAIGDRVVFSGLVRLEPLVAAIEALRADASGYASYRAHYGDPPVG